MEVREKTALVNCCLFSLGGAANKTRSTNWPAAPKLPGNRVDELSAAKGARWCRNLGLIYMANFIFHSIRRGTSVLWSAKLRHLD